LKSVQTDDDLCATINLFYRAVHPRLLLTEKRRSAEQTRIAARIHGRAGHGMTVIALDKFTQGT
jgi:hypothetical protein